MYSSGWLKAAINDGDEPLTLNGLSPSVCGTEHGYFSILQCAL